jgi:hypothetical protein
MKNQRLSFKTTKMPMREDVRARLNHIITKVRLAIIEGTEMESDTDDGYVTMCRLNAVDARALKDRDPGFAYIPTTKGSHVAPSSAIQRLAVELVRFVLSNEIKVYDERTTKATRSNRIKVSR